MKTAPRILIVEDEPLIAEDIADLCRLNGYEVCGTAYTPAQALSMIEQYKPTLVLLDINLEAEVDGLDIAAHLKKNYVIPFLFLTSYADRDTLARARETAPLGYIVKPFNKEQLYSSIEIAWGQLQQRVVQELDMERINRRMPEPLRAREAEVLSCIYKGLDTKGTAEALFVSVNTVKFHLKNLYDKFDAHSRVELMTRLREMMRKG
jgi:two-component system, response regulator PdtaR